MYKRQVQEVAEDLPEALPVDVDGESCGAGGGDGEVDAGVAVAVPDGFAGVPQQVRDCDRFGQEAEPAFFGGGDLIDVLGEAREPVGLFGEGSLGVGAELDDSVVQAVVVGGQCGDCLLYTSRCV